MSGGCCEAIQISLEPFRLAEEIQLAKSHPIKVLRPIMSG
jgi:hypothetical protein